MGKTFGSFKLSVGDTISSFGRNLIIIGREYRPKNRTKNGKLYISNTKWYYYRCIDCGNEDWIIEHALFSKQPSGCNVCCTSPKKVIKGVNDIATTDPWMVRLFVDKEDAYTNLKYSKKCVDMKCPDCGRIQKKSILQVMSSRSLSCTCGDGKSYPNKFVYSLLDQAGICFEIEKTFPWSNCRFYDVFFMLNGESYLIEMNGKQHYARPIAKGIRYRSVECEIENDAKKFNLAKENGIDHYYSINCSQSSVEFIKGSIIASGLLDDLNVLESSIDWTICDLFAKKNLVREVCLFKKNNPDAILDDIALKFHLNRKTILRYVKEGAKIGWCDYERNEDRKKKDADHLIDHGSKPVFCETTGQTFRNATEAARFFQTQNDPWNGRAIRKSIERNQMYKKHKFKYAV